jgi:hypothetical protein
MQGRFSQRSRHCLAASGRRAGHIRVSVAVPTGQALFVPGQERLDANATAAVRPHSASLEDVQLPSGEPADGEDVEHSFKELGVDDRLTVRGFGWLAMNGLANGLACTALHVACAMHLTKQNMLDNKFDVQMMLWKLGIDAPSEIQVAAIPVIRKGTTMAIQSFTGSGKVCKHPSCIVYLILSHHVLTLVAPRAT